MRLEITLAGATVQKLKRRRPHITIENYIAELARKDAAGLIRAKNDALGQSIAMKKFLEDELKVLESGQRISTVG